MFQSRFKPFLIPHDQLKTEAVLLRQDLEAIERISQSQNLHPAEVVYQVLKIYLQQRSTGPFWMKSSKQVSQHVLDLDLLKFAESFQFKKLPGGILKTLVRWKTAEIKLHLFDIVPTPEEVLALQARGERVVTINFDKAKQGELVDGKRDTLEFLLHDLVHADLFFGETHLEQVRFFNRLEIVGRDLHSLIESDEDFYQKIQYVMSDMNSHPEHMRQSVRAALVDHFKKLCVYDLKGSLDLSIENKISSYISRLSF